MKRWNKWLFALFGVALLAQCGTYFWMADSQRPLAGLRTVGGLSRWGEFVEFPRQTWDALSPAQREALTNSLAGRVTHIYHSTAEVPDANIEFRPLTDHDRQSYAALTNRADLPIETIEAFRRNLERGTKMMGFRNGCSLSWHLERSGPFWMKCNSGLYMSGTGAVGRTDLFLWMFGRWWRVWNFSLMMA